MLSGRQFIKLSTTNVLIPSCTVLFLASCGADPPPPGDDLIRATCRCIDECLGNFPIFLTGYVCTDASNPANVEDALAFLCEAKETRGFNVCKIINCVQDGMIEIMFGGCPADNGQFLSGDFGQSSATAVPPSSVEVSGGDINSFTIVPDSAIVQTTQIGNTLLFADMVADLGEAVFTSDGIFGDDEHTLSEGLLLAGAFTVQLQPDGSYLIPQGAGNFIVTGLLDGDRLSLTLVSVNLGGFYDEEIGLFTMSGAIDAVGADIVMDVDFVFQFDNRPPRANAGPDQVVECDSTALEGSVHLSSSGSFDLDGNDDIALFTWYADRIKVATGPEVDVDLSLGQHEITLIVADQLGKFGGDISTVTVEDTLPPEIEIVQPDDINYVHSDTITLDYTVVDICTGVNNFTPLLDGADMLAGHGLQSGQDIHLLTELPLGMHTFEIETVDNEGNMTSSSVTFSVVVTPESIQEDVVQFVANGAITNPSRGRFLLKRAEAAAVAYANGNCAAALGIYGSFINTLEAQRGHHVDATAADIMIADAQFLIDNCPWIATLPRCLADCNGDGAVNVPDLLTLLAASGTNPGGPPDLDGDGVVAVPDLLMMLAAWGPCQ